jgi:hypothetical protein
MVSRERNRSPGLLYQWICSTGGPHHDGLVGSHSMMVPLWDISAEGTEPPTARLPTPFAGREKWPGV